MQILGDIRYFEFYRLKVRDFFNGVVHFNIQQSYFLLLQKYLGKCKILSNTSKSLKIQ